MKIGRWRMKNGGWRMEHDEWRMEDRGWRMEDEDRSRCIANENKSINRPLFSPDSAVWGHGRRLAYADRGQ